MKGDGKEATLERAASALESADALASPLQAARRMLASFDAAVLSEALRGKLHRLVELRK